MSQVGHRLALGHARNTKTRDVSQTGPTVNKAHVAVYESTVTPKRAAQENTKKRTHYTQSVREERGRRKYAAMLARILYNTYIQRITRCCLVLGVCISQKERTGRRGRKSNREREHINNCYLYLFLLIQTYTHTITFSWICLAVEEVVSDICMYVCLYVCLSHYLSSLINR